MTAGWLKCLEVHPHPDGMEFVPLPYTWSAIRFGVTSAFAVGAFAVGAFAVGA